MKSDIIHIDNQGVGFEAALAQTGKVAQFRELGEKEALRLRICAEEMLGLARSVTGEMEADFWLENERRLEDWYIRQRRDDDLIISASPEFLLAPICDKLHVRLIATRMDPYTGQIKGRNCHGKEKVRRFLELYPADSVDCFYSDSLCDSPMAALAKKAFLVDDGDLIPWPE